MKRIILSLIVLLAGACSGLAEEAPQRVVTLDHRYTESVLLLGATPVGVADLNGFQKTVGFKGGSLNQATPLGSKTEPDLESVIMVKPDLIIGTRFRHRVIHPVLSQIAPTVLMKFTGDMSPEEDHLAAMKQEFLSVGELLHKEPEAKEVLKALDRQMSTFAAKEKRGTSGRKLIFLQFLSGSHKVRWYQDNSIPGRLLSEMGFDVVNPPSRGIYGFNVVGLDRLRLYDDSSIMYMTKGDGASLARIQASALWRHLPAVRQKRVTRLNAQAWPFGGPWSAQQFVKAVVQAGSER